MTICREATLVKTTDREVYLRCLECRSWGCEHCGPKRARQLRGKIRAGLPNRFITLTINPQVGEGPEDRLKKLSHAWRLIVQRLRRAKPNDTIDYFAVVEATERGEPHLHILGRLPYVHQSVLSEWMKELADSPIVDIRAVRSVRKAALYVSKYVTKSLVRFGTSKRYWCSQTYELKDGSPYEPPTPSLFRWQLDERHIDRVIRELAFRGYGVRLHTDNILVGIPGPHVDSG